jgi:hypothetical protein
VGFASASRGSLVVFCGAGLLVQVTRSRGQARRSALSSASLTRAIRMLLKPLIVSYCTKFIFFKKKELENTLSPFRILGLEENLSKKRSQVSTVRKR